MIDTVDDDGVDTLLVIVALPVKDARNEAEYDTTDNKTLEPWERAEVARVIDD